MASAAVTPGRLRARVAEVGSVENLAEVEERLTVRRRSVLRAALCGASAGQARPGQASGTGAAPRALPGAARDSAMAAVRPLLCCDGKDPFAAWHSRSLLQNASLVFRNSVTG